jgi:hypothetical protein
MDFEDIPAAEEIVYKVEESNILPDPEPEEDALT